jgi:AcrR family transcriptional regulator
MTQRVSDGDIEASAAAIADERGLDGVTMTSVAERIGVRAPSLYGHVRDRGALLDRLTLHALHTLADGLSVALAGLSARDALAGFADAHRRLAHDHPGLWAAMQRPVTDRVAAASDGGRLVVLTQGVLRGYRLPDDQLVHAVRLLGATINGFIAVERTGGFSHSAPAPEASWRRIVDALDALFRAWPADAAHDQSEGIAP